MIDFLKSCRSKSTMKTYRRGIVIFMRYIYDDSKDDPQDLVDRYFSDDRNYRNDLVGFIDYMEEKYAPKTINVYIAGINELLIFHEIELSKLDLRNIKRKKPRATKVSMDKPISIDVLHKIVDHMSNVDSKGKALVLFLASSGCRIGEALSIDVNDVDMTLEPARIYIRGTESKNQGNRTTFISGEAKEALKKWIGEKKDNLEKRKNKYKFLDIDINDKRLFPFRIQTAYTIWETSLKRSGLDKEIDQRTGRNLYTFHGLRRFFKTRLTGHLESEIVEKLMGHEGYLNGSYYRVSDDEMATKYLKAMDRLETRSLEESASRFESMEDEIDDLKNRNDGLISAIDYMKEDIAKMKSFAWRFKEAKDSKIESLEDDKITLKDENQMLRSKIESLEDH